MSNQIIESEIEIEEEDEDLMENFSDEMLEMMIDEDSLKSHDFDDLVSYVGTETYIIKNKNQNHQMYAIRRRLLIIKEIRSRLLKVASSRNINKKYAVIKTDNVELELGKLNKIKIYDVDFDSDISFTYRNVGVSIGFLVNDIPKFRITEASHYTRRSFGIRVFKENNLWCVQITDVDFAIQERLSDYEHSIIFSSYMDN